MQLTESVKSVILSKARHGGIPMTIEKWCIFEKSFKGRSDGNPFCDYNIVAEFKSKYEQITVDGFYDGDGVYKVRFMPSYEGEYSYTVYGSFSDRKHMGKFNVLPAREGNHGPVGVAGKYHFAYADGTPIYPLGTTCYVWTHQSDEIISKTLKTLKKSPFNKIRFCIFPKHYDYNLGEPRSYPYIGSPMDSSALTKDNFYAYGADSKGNNWDFTMFNTEHFKHIEKCIKRLMDMGIEADIILFHPYDRWGFSKMTRKQDELYIKYAVARFASFRNVWWSIANEYDILGKSVDDWEFIADTLVKSDKYSHLRSIHNCIGFYDHTRPWITHCSIQRQDIYRTVEYTDEWRKQYGKPIVLDEIAYEGNIQHGWGNISAKELTRRFWEAAVRGGYAGHGETYLSDDNILWWSHGGKLKGESPKRIAFLFDILKTVPSYGLKRGEGSWDEVVGVPQDDDVMAETGYRLYYYGFMRPSFRDYYFDDDTLYTVDVIDTWNMTVTNQGIFKGRFRIPLPGKEYMAVRIKKA